MKTSMVVFSIVAALAVPSMASAASVDPSLIPDGQYVVKVERIEDAHHMTVLMQNGIETTLVARSSVDFSKLHPNDTVRVALVKGEVPVYQAM